MWKPRMWPSWSRCQRWEWNGHLDFSAVIHMSLKFTSVEVAEFCHNYGTLELKNQGKILEIETRILFIHISVCLIWKEEILSGLIPFHPIICSHYSAVCAAFYQTRCWLQKIVPCGLFMSHRELCFPPRLCSMQLRCDPFNEHILLLKLKMETVQ